MSSLKVCGKLRSMNCRALQLHSKNADSGRRVGVEREIVNFIETQNDLIKEKEWPSFKPITDNKISWLLLSFIANCT